MDFLTTTSSSDLGVFALGLVLAGIVGGLVAGMLGVGGGIVIVPVLYHVLATLGVDESIRMHVAVGTSLATIIPTSFSSVTAHNKKGAVDWELLRRWAIPMVIGVLAGSAIAGIVSGRTLALIFGIVALPVAIHFAFGGDKRRFADHLPTGAGGLALPAFIGGISTMMGIGGGTVGSIIAGLHVQHLPPYSLGYVNLLGFLLIAPASYFVAPFGATIAHMTDVKNMRLIFALFIAITTARMLWDALA
jgi:uncharacterized membrane protein YfcA